MLHRVATGGYQAALFMSSMLSGARSVLEAHFLVKGGDLPARLRRIQLQLTNVNYLGVAALVVILVCGSGQEERLTALIRQDLRLDRRVGVHVGCKSFGARVLRQSRLASHELLLLALLSILLVKLQL